jgi:virulence-associated protein VapD
MLAMQAKWVIAYDLSVKQMKAAGYTKSQVTQYYNGVKNCLSNHGFSRFTQGSIYGIDDEKDVLTKVYQFIDCIRQIKDPHFVNRLHLFKAESMSDLRPLLPSFTVSETSDPIEEKIEDVFAGEEA